MDQLPNNQKKTFSWVLSVVILLLLIVLIVLLVNKKNEIANSPDNNTQIADISSQTTEPLTAAYFKLVPGSNQNKVGDNIELLIEADSDAKVISGFDLLLAYDKSSFDFIKIESLDKNYKVFNYKASTHLSITGSRDLSSKTQSALKKSSLIKATFKAKSIGNYQFALKPKIDKEVTIMVDTNTKKIVPGVNEITVQVK